jgi:hypothetical protein
MVINKRNESNYKIKLLGLTFSILVLFFTVFSISPAGWIIKPRILMMIFVSVLFIKYILVNQKAINFRMNKTDFQWIISASFILIYTYLITISNHLEGQENALSSTFNFFLFVGIFPFLVLPIFKDEIHFSKAMTLATLIHSLIVIFSFLNPSVRFFLESFQTFTFERYAFRVVGLGIAGAGGSVYLFSGLITNAYLLIFSNEKSKYIYLYSFILIFIAIALVGRTGFYCALMLLVFMILLNIHKVNLWTNKILRIIIPLIPFMIIAYFVTKNIEYNKELFNYTYNRLFELFNNGSTVKELNQMNDTLPPLSFHTFFGTGVTRGAISTGLNIQHDGGYAKRYASIGVLGLIISYFVFFMYILRLTSNVPIKARGFIIFNLILLYVIEYKEPFMFMLAYPFILIMLSKLINKRISYSNTRYK